MSMIQKGDMVTILGSNPNLYGKKGIINHPEEFENEDNVLVTIEVLNEEGKVCGITGIWNRYLTIEKK